jgi:hypothetical protein
LIGCRIYSINTISQREIKMSTEVGIILVVVLVGVFLVLRSRKSDTTDTTPDTTTGGAGGTSRDTPPNMKQH